MFFTNVCFTKKNSFCERIKLRPVSSVKNTPFTFFAFFSPCLSIFLKKNSSPDFWGVKEAPCKNLYVFDENSQRNQFPKLTTFLLHFSLMSPLCHSAMAIICKSFPRVGFSLTKLTTLLISFLCSWCRSSYHSLLSLPFSLPSESFCGEEGWGVGGSLGC